MTLDVVTYTIIRDVVTYTFIPIFLIDMIFKPRLDRTPKGEVFLWYTNHRKKKRRYIKLSSK